MARAHAAAESGLHGPQGKLAQTTAGLYEGSVQGATIGRAEVRRFVAAKDLASIGLAPVRRKAPVPAGSVEVLLEKAKAPVRVAFFSTPPLAAEQLVAARVDGRGDTLVVDASVWDDVRSFAVRLKAAGAEVIEQTAAKYREALQRLLG